MEESLPVVSPSRAWNEALGAAAALGAGLIHAAAIGPHAGHGVVPALFAVAALTGLVSGLAFLLRPSRPILALVAGAHLLMLVTWIATRSGGIGFVDGLEARESIGFPDAVAACFEATAVGAALLVAGRSERVGVVSRIATLAVVAGLVAVPAVGAAAIYRAGASEHPHGEGAGSGHEGAEQADAEDAAHGAEATDHADADHQDADHAVPVPFDPSEPVDLSGTPGVSQVQQKQAELLLAQTLAVLPKYSDPATAQAEGYRSIGDGFTGFEHYIDWSKINDDVILDPNEPESLVYETSSGPPTLVAAMYVLPDTFTLDSVPDIGGSLIQWHIHDDLCFTTGYEPVVAGITSVGGECGAGLQKFQPSPMIHVWIQENACGPFAALEGVGAGQTKDGARACDHGHGSSGGP